MWVLLLCLGEAWLTSAASITTAMPAASSQAPPTEDHSTQLVDWLLKYGYLPPPDPSTGQLQAWSAVTSAVRSMQRFAGLNDTGVLDKETAALMKTPRCSLPDGEQLSGGAAHQEQRLRRRRRRTVTTWSSRNINWRLQSYPSSSALPRDTVRSLVYYALRVWAQPTPLDFHEVGSPGDTDLQVDFHHGFHGDDYPFDGVGGAVGHAFFPSDPVRAGGVHLDAEEEWAFRQTAAEGTDLFTVLLHELGHALGLSHSSSRHSLMRPYYQGPAGDPLHYRLGTQDLESITQLYGNRQQLKTTDAPPLEPDLQLKHRPRPHPHSHTHPHPHPHHRGIIDRCNTSFDAVAKIRGETFFFKGLSMWRVSSSGLVSSRGAAVRRLWRPLPLDLRLRAVLERASDHAIIFISGSQVWLFRDLSLQEGYPAPLSTLETGLGVEGESGETQGLLWEAEEEGPIWGDTGAVTPGTEADVWTRLLKEGVNGITTDEDGAVYMFSGASYWKFPFPGSALEEGYPRSIAADWLDCPASGLLSPSLPHLISPTGGRQELRESRGEDLGLKEVGGRKDRGDEELRERKHTGEHVWTHCTCQSRAEARTVDGVVFLWTFLSVLVGKL